MCWNWAWSVLEAFLKSAWSNLEKTQEVGKRTHCQLGHSLRLHVEAKMMKLWCLRFQILTLYRTCSAPLLSRPRLRASIEMTYCRQNILAAKLWALLRHKFSIKREMVHYINIFLLFLKVFSYVKLELLLPIGALPSL